MKFTIPVKMYSVVEFEVDDENVETFEEARDKAIDMAYNHDWSREDHWYQAADEKGDFDD